ncbi:MAG: SAM-dependent methyltransferase [Gemmatimonadaceae bacterium]
MPDYPRPVVVPTLVNRRTNDARARTEWTNLGFWRGVRRYGEAARELARRVGEAAKLTEGDIVLDCACGYGDSIRLWIEQFGVKHVFAVEPDPGITAHIMQRVKLWGLGDQVTVLTMRAEAVVLAQHAPGITAVVCVDAAYHFDTRSSWLATLGQQLPAGTRIGLADLSIARLHYSRLVAAIARRTGIPEVNLWALDEIEPQMSEAGFTVDRLLRCGSEVLGGFARYVTLSPWRFLSRPRLGGWRAIATALGLFVARRGERLEYVLITAHKVRGRISASTRPLA